jgi:ATP-dependent Clp protease ATP-binding subunit ClpC
MQFSLVPPFPLISCPVCFGSGIISQKKCPECHGACFGRMARGKFLYFGKSLHRDSFRFEKVQKILYRTEMVAAVLTVFGSFAYFLFSLAQNNLQGQIFDSKFWENHGVQGMAWFWFAWIAAGFLLYRSNLAKIKEDAVEAQGFKKDEVLEDLWNSGAIVNFEAVNHLPKKSRKDISVTLSPDALSILQDAYEIADKHHEKEIRPIHIFYSLMSSSKISMLFLRLGLPAQKMQEKIAELFVKGENMSPPHVSLECGQVIFQAYENAYQARRSRVHVTELLEAVMGMNASLQEWFYDLGVEENKLRNVIEWIRIREKMREQYMKFRVAASHRNKYGLDRAMTAVATPYLNSFSQDLTRSAAMGYLTTCVAREKEIQEILRAVDAGRSGVVLVGDHGVGKMTIIDGIAERMVEDAVPVRMYDRRLVQLSTTALVAGVDVNGAQERLIHMMSEIARAKNCILFINNLQDLVTGQGFDISETLAEYLSSGRFLIIATATSDGYNRHILNTSIGSLFARVDIPEMEENAAVQVVESKVGGIEYEQNVFFSYEAVESCVKLSQRFLRDQKLPESAVDLCNEVASFVKSARGEHQLVTRDDVAAVIGQKTGVPVTSITRDESSKLLQLEEEMHKRVVGQAEAVSAVSNALRRARAEIRSTKRPIANFLFLGPTGVGKTELAKTIAEVYFGGENRMVRLDMSEYQDVSSIYRLIGRAGEQGTGILTEAVRQRPFSLVLLDEMEKAHPQVLDLFLQVFDDGRLTDSTGRVIDFTNTIVIATSNAGTRYVQEQIQAGVSQKMIQDALMRTELKTYFRPEFLNRFDGVVLFHPLTREDTKTIAEYMLKRIAKDLDARGIAFRVEASALEYLATVGFDPEFGARPMRRAIQDLVENKLAEMILENKVGRKDTVVFEGSELRVENKI